MNNKLGVIQVVGGVGVTVIIVMFLVGLLAGSNLLASPEVRQARDAAAIERAELTARQARALYWPTVVGNVALVVVVVVAVALLAGALVVAVWRRALSVWPDERGLYPLLLWRVNGNEPGAQLAAVVPMPQVYHDKRTVTIGGPAVLPAPSAAMIGPAMLPTRVNLVDILDGEPGVERLTLGLGPGGPVVASLHDLMHVLCVGASGWGKSTWLRSFLFQLAVTHDAVGVVAIDCSGSEFNPLANWSKLLWPVAREPGQAVAVLGEVSSEIARRRGLYEQYPLVTKLSEYNRLSGDGLVPWVVVADEGTALLNQAGISEPLRAAVQTSRQYGIYVLLAGQSAKSDVIDTQVRDNFSSRLCFRTSPTSSRVVLDDRGAADLKAQGRGLLLLPGHDLVEIQAGYIGREAFYNALAGGGPAMAMPGPVAVGVDVDALNDEEKILYYHGRGHSQAQIERDVFGFNGGAAYRKVKAVLAGSSSSDEADLPTTTADGTTTTTESWADFADKVLDRYG